MLNTESSVLLSVILPIRNEEGILVRSCEAFAKEYDAVVGEGKWQFILVENGSTDSTPEIIKTIVEKWPRSIPLSIGPGNYGRALRLGIEASEGENLMILNVDHLWDRPFFKWAWANRNEYDLVIGSKRCDPTLNSQSRYRRMLSAGLNALLNYLFDFSGSDTHGMKLMKAISMKPLADECVMSRGQFDTELTLRALRNGLWVGEAPIPYAEKRSPRNFMFKKIFQNVFDLFTLYKVMDGVPYDSSIRYRRVARDDIAPPE